MIHQPKQVDEGDSNPRGLTQTSRGGKFNPDQPGKRKTANAVMELKELKLPFVIYTYTYHILILLLYTI